MIIFTDKPELIPYIQSNKHWSASSIPVSGGNTYVYNFSSLYHGYEDATCFLTKAAPMNHTGKPMPEFVDSVDFDIQYATAIMNDPQMFGLFVKMMCQSFNGNLVILLVQRDNYRDLFMESLIKFIQQRYGYGCWIVESLEDIQSIGESIYKPNGLMVIADDINRYQSMFGESPYGSPLPIYEYR